MKQSDRGGGGYCQDCSVEIRSAPVGCMNNSPSIWLEEIFASDMKDHLVQSWGI